MTTQENIVLLVSRNKNLAPRYLRNVSRLVILSGPVTIFLKKECRAGTCDATWNPPTNTVKHLLTGLHANPEFDANFKDIFNIYLSLSEVNQAN